MKFCKKNYKTPANFCKLTIKFAKFYFNLKFKNIAIKVNDPNIV